MNYKKRLASAKCVFGSSGNVLQSEAIEDHCTIAGPAELEAGSSGAGASESAGGFQAESVPMEAVLHKTVSNRWTLAQKCTSPERTMTK